jgi:predicted DNA-binding transcriptional regulator YafY
VLVDAPRASIAIADLGEERLLERHDDGSIEVGVPCANLPAFRSWLLGYLEHAEVLSPSTVRDEVVAWLEQVGS